MKRIIVLLTVLLFVFAPGYSQSEPNINVPEPGSINLYDSEEISALRQLLKIEPENVDYLININAQLIREAYYKEAEHYAFKLRELGKARGNEKAVMYGSMFIGHLVCRGLWDAAADSVYRYYHESLDLAQKLQDRNALCSIYNGLAIYAADCEMDHYKSIRYYMLALEYADKEIDPRLYAIVNYNLAFTYYHRNDPAGLQYAEEVYQLALEKPNNFLMFMGAFVCSYLNYLIEDYDLALDYMDKALTVGKQYISLAEAYSHYANILSALGRKSEAEEYYRKAMDNLGIYAPESDVMSYLSYGSYLLDKGEVYKAISLLEEGEKLADRINSKIYHYKINRKLSEAYIAIGDFRRALQYFKVFQVESDSIFNIERERSINDMRIKYETEKTEKELQVNENRLLKARKRLHIILFVAIIAMVTLIMTYLLYRKKDRMYKQIVLREREFLRKEKRLEAMLKKYSEENTGNPSDDPVENEEPSTNSRLEELFDELEKMMQQEHLYREKDLNRDKIAKLLNTNRTYLSRALAECAGQTFYNYINAYRVNEAVRILSETDSEIPLKALADHLGYNSPSTFHTSFENMIGMSPSKYRKKILQLSSDNAVK